MYIRTRLLLFILVVGAIFISCQKEITYDNADPNGVITPPGGVTTPPGGGGVTGSFTAKIDGTSFVANTVATANRESGVIVLYGLSSSDKKNILLRVADSGVHNYTFTVNSMSNFAAYTDSALSPVAAFATNQWPTEGNYGNLDITSIDTTHKTMSGTFSLKVYRSLDNKQRTISNGVFTNISYSTNGSQQVNSKDSFRVKIAGTDFLYTSLTGVNYFGTISVSASNAGGSPTVGISVPNTATPGTYAFDSFTYIGQYNPSNSVFLAADGGNVTILENNTTTKRIRGTFNFLANTAFTHDPPNIQLTEGYFSVGYN
ncbi:MAG: DUF6252 family protein [Ferruginibacter sp.]